MISYRNSIISIIQKTSTQERVSSKREDLAVPVEDVKGEVSVASAPVTAVSTVDTVSPRFL